MCNRYCSIKATTLEEILATCNRHIENIAKTEMDLIENEDGTESDFWWVNMHRATWTDLRDDVEEMLQKVTKTK